MEEHTITTDLVRTNMSNRKIIILSIIGIVVVVVIVVAVLGIGKKNNSMKVTNNIPTPTKEVEFVVIRALPSGFSPKEVSIKKGMIVRFTNPIDTRVILKWDGATQYTSEAVYDGHDISTNIFNNKGVYVFFDGNAHQGKVVVK